MHAVGCGEPLAEPPTLVALVPLEAEVVVAIGKIHNRARGGLNVSEFVGIEFVTIVELALHGLEPTVFFDDCQTFRHNLVIFERIKIHHFGRKSKFFPKKRLLLYV